jgi:hypothetical protein
MKVWTSFGYRVKYSEFARLITIMLGDFLSKEWICGFLEHHVTKSVFQSFKVADQIDLIARLLAAFGIN